MKVEAKAALPNSLVLVMDFKSGDPPDNMGGALIAANETCLAIGTLAEQSGKTDFVLSDNLDEAIHADLHVVFDGRIRCSSGEISLMNVLNERLLSLPTLTADVRVRVLVNDDTEPDRITVVLG